MVLLISYICGIVSVELKLLQVVCKIISGRGVRGAVRCGFGPFLAPHFAVRFRQNHNCTTPHFCSHMCGVMWCGLELAKTITTLHLIFAITCMVRCIRCGLKLIYFLDFGLFLPSKKLIFPFVLSQVLKY